MRICSVEGCGAKHTANGLCNRHYLQSRTRKAPRFDGTKACNQCGIEKPIEQFSRCGGNRDGRRHECRLCHARYHVERRKDERTRRNDDYRTNYGITLADYERMIEEQNGECAICGRSPKRGLVVDHCHKMGKVRALLCQPCNSGLGLFKEDIDLLTRVAEYIRKHRE